MAIRLKRIAEAVGIVASRRLCLSASLLLLLTLPAHLIAQKQTITPVKLQAANKIDPIGFDQSSLVFGWTLRSEPATGRDVRQSAYRILVASSAQKLDRQIGDVWDSRRVTAQTFWQLPYRGADLRSQTEYFWKVQAWDGSGTPGPWSAPAHFTTGILHPADWTAKWIAAPATGASAPLPVFRKDVNLAGQVAQALLSVSGLGQYEVRLNGSDVTKTVLNPAWSNYRKTAPYDTYDVTTLLHTGSNAVAVLLGNGMYNVEQTKGRYTKFTGSFGAVKFILQMEVRYRDGTSRRFISDASWLTHPGPITFSSIYGGEDFDAGALPAGWDMAGFKGAGWQPVVEVDGPGGALEAEPSSPMVIAQTYKPVAVSHPLPGIAVYDLGENMSGWPEISVRGPAGSRVTLLPGELLAKDGTVSQHSTNAAPGHAVLYRYTLRGDAAAEHWHPRFTYHSFRYVQVTAEPAAVGEAMPEVLELAGDFVHADAPVIGTFETSDALFDRIHTLIDRAVLSNLASVMTDCPSREKLGWLEQTYLNAATLMLNYDVTGLYEKMSRDILEAQLPNGLVPSIAPEYVAFVDAKGDSTAFRDSPEWGSAIILSPWALYQYTGDIEPLRASYAAMQRYADYLESRAVDGMIDYGLGDWYDIGPKPPGPSQLTSRKVTATGVYYEDLVALTRIAALLGRPDDAASYKARADRERELFNQALFHPETGQYDLGSQTANAIPLALGMVPPEHVQAVLDHLVADIHAHGDHVTAGDVGFHYVVRALTNFHRSDVLAAMFSRTDSPSYGYQLAQGATTLTEAWDANPNSSQNHFMLGHGEEWFYRGLAGLTLDMARGPDEAISLRPSLLAGIAQASATHRTPMGEVSIAWKRDGDSAAVDAIIPVGARARLLLPAAQSWLEGSVSAGKAVGVIDQTSTADGLQLMLASGSYHFRTATLQHATQAKD
jgi:alpha-L-rhamnosidase